MSIKIKKHFRVNFSYFVSGVILISSLVLSVNETINHSIANIFRKPDSIAKASFESSSSSSYLKPSLVAVTLPLLSQISSSNSQNSNIVSSFSLQNSNSVVSKNQNSSVKSLLSSIASLPLSGQNLLIYPKYNIVAPIVYSTNADFFNTLVDGSVDFSSPKEATTVNSPVQLLLRKGIVHVAYTPLPGQYGNCYILGHSSNYEGVESSYNNIFAPIKAKSQVGDEFYVFNSSGAKLDYRVFETKAISLNDSAEALKDFPDKKVITLQTSYNGGAWITRGESI